MEETGHYYFSPDIPRDVYQPALFTGTSGIGYALLRLAYPAELPSIMLWE
jgi:lantibiotic modifying enzyme